MRKYGYFYILKAKVGLRIIRGCVLYAENYGTQKVHNNMTRSNLLIMENMSDHKPA